MYHVIVLCMWDYFVVNVIDNSKLSCLVCEAKNFNIIKMKLLH